MEDDVFGAQKQLWWFICRQSKAISKNQSNTQRKENWIQHLTELYRTKQKEAVINTSEIVTHEGLKKSQQITDE